MSGLTRVITANQCCLARPSCLVRTGTGTNHFPCYPDHGQDTRCKGILLNIRHGHTHKSVLLVGGIILESPGIP